MEVQGMLGNGRMIKDGTELKNSNPDKSLVSG